MSGSIRTIEKILRLPSPQELIDTLECPVCLDVPIPPIRIYTCNTGHNVCGTCKDQLDDCALCHTGMSNKRNFFAENVLSSSIFKCTYEQYGCNEKLKGSEHENHAKVCTFRPIICNNKICDGCDGVPVRVKDYLEHLRKHHQVIGSTKRMEEGNEFPIVTKRCSLFDDRETMQYFIVYSGRQFLTHCHIKNNIVYKWITLLTVNGENKRYKATLSLSNSRNDNVVQCNWTLPVHPAHTDFESILQSGLCATMPALAMKQFLKADGPFLKMSFTYKIERQ